MKIAVIFYLFILFYTNLSLGASETIRVRLVTLPLNINVQGLGVVFEANANSYKKVGVPRLESFQVQFKNDLWVIESPNFSKKVKSQFLALEGDDLQINSSLVPSKVFLWPRGDRVDVIAALPMESYLEGVLPHEMPALWPMEALKAQAVVARSFTLSQVRARSRNPFHLDSTVNDQVYKYNEKITPKNLLKVKKAIELTHNEVLVDLKQQVVRTLYHADCGGKTERSSNVWGGEPSLYDRSVEDRYCSQGESKKWVFEISKKDLSKKLGIDFVAETVRKDALTDSGRVQRVVVISKLKSLNLSSQELRKKMGYTKIKSTRFEIYDLKDRIQFEGRGFGHGVGLCQWGTKSWAQAGKDYKEILKHYFPGYKLHTL